MSLILANHANYVPSFAETAGYNVIAVGEYETTDWRDGSSKVTLDYTVIEIAKGRVVHMWCNQNVRVMSDVWADTFHCVIALTDGTFLEVAYHSNHGGSHMDKFLKCEVDAPELKGAWEAWDVARRAKEHAEHEERMRPAREAYEAQAKKSAERKAKLQAKLDGARAQAEQLLAQAPGKGTRVKVGTTVGEVFWAGVTQHRGKMAARLGVRTGRGRNDVLWCDVTEVTKA